MESGKCIGGLRQGRGCDGVEKERKTKGGRRQGGWRRGRVNVCVGVSLCVCVCVCVCVCPLAYGGGDVWVP